MQANTFKHSNIKYRRKVYSNIEYFLCVKTNFSNRYEQMYVHIVSF